MSTLKSLPDVRAEFAERKRSVWRENTDYWLQGRLRHVTDVGEFLLCRVMERISSCDSPSPVVLDMGCGNGWLATGLYSRDMNGKYIGIDFNEGFISYCKMHTQYDSRFEYHLMDIEKSTLSSTNSYTNGVDIVANFFNFFELVDLDQAMKNAAAWLKPDGRLMIMTIDKTFLLLGAATNWRELIQLLREYSEQPGVKCFFQPVDLGDGLSEDLIYPSVLYSMEDYLDAANNADLKLTLYKELPFTARPIPKIYTYFELSPR